ncbi:hypothetical protein [Mycoplasma capricolum]
MKKNKLLSKSYKIAILLLTATSGLSLTTLIKNVNQDNTVVRLYQDGSGNSGSTSGNGNNGTSNGNDNTTNSTDPLTPKISDQFDTFKEKAEKSIKETLEKVQKKATEIIEQELGKLKKLDEGTDKSE